MTRLHTFAVATVALAALASCGTTMESRAATGAAAGLIVGGPVGAAVGAVAGAVIDVADGQDGQKGN